MADRKLQKSPLALLAALDMKVGGENPDLFGDAVVPVYPVLDQYLLDRLKITTLQTPVAAPTQTNTSVITLGLREYFYLKGFSVGITVDAADVAVDSFSTLYLTDPQGGLHFMQNAQGVTSSTLLRAATANGSGLPCWLSPGWKLSAYTELLTAPAAAWTVQFNVWGNLITD